MPRNTGAGTMPKRKASPPKYLLDASVGLWADVTETPLPRRHFRHDLTNALISAGIVLAVFVAMPAVGGWIAEAVLNRG